MLKAPNFLPLSQFFLAISGEGEEGEGDGEKRNIRGYRVKRDGEGEKGDKNAPIGKVHFDGGERARTRAAKSARPKGKPRKPLGGDEEEEFEESRGGTAHFTGTASKPQKCKFCDSAATKSLIWADGRAYIPCCDEHEDKARSKIEDDNDDSVTYVRKIDETFAGPVKVGATHATIGATGSGNVATAPRPIGRPIRRMDPKTRKRWVENLTKLGT